MICLIWTFFRSSRLPRVSGQFHLTHCTRQARVLSLDLHAPNEPGIHRFLKLAEIFLQQLLQGARPGQGDCVVFHLHQLLLPKFCQGT
jgi:hypothetical protein